MNAHETPRFSFRRASGVFFVGLAALVLAVRFYYCFQRPLYTTDLLRNLGYGKAFWDYGFALYDMTAFDLSPWPCQFLWHNYHYTYPPLTLLLFSLIAALHTSMVWGKIALTIFDGFSAWIIGKASGDRWLGMLYWINPISIWYTSREGQFEGYVVFWTVLSVWALQRRKPWAYGLLGAAVQTKFFPLFLGSLFLARMSWKAPARLAREWAWGLAAFLPSLLAFMWGGYPEHLMEKNYVPPVNPISWSIGEPGVYQHFPVWLISSHWFVSVGFLLFCLYGMRRTRQVLPWIAPVVFVVLVRLSQMAQFWYFMLLPAFCLPVEDNKLRRILFIWSAAFGLLSFHSIFFGPAGYLNPPDAVIILKKAFWGF